MKVRACDMGCRVFPRFAKTTFGQKLHADKYMVTNTHSTAELTDLQAQRPSGPREDELFELR